MEPPEATPPYPGIGTVYGTDPQPYFNHFGRQLNPNPEEQNPDMTGSFYPEGANPQAQLPKDRAMVKDAYTVIPRGVLQNTVTSNLPGWENTRSWIVARPIEGFATSFSQLIVEVGPGGGSPKPEPEAAVEGSSS